jgi:hypothetical protein
MEHQTFRVRISNLKVQMVEHDIHIEISFDIKFCSFLIFFVIF